MALVSTCTCVGLVFIHFVASQTGFGWWQLTRLSTSLQQVQHILYSKRVKYDGCVFTATHMHSTVSTCTYVSHLLPKQLHAEPLNTLVEESLQQASVCAVYVYVILEPFTIFDSSTSASMLPKSQIQHGCP